MSTRSVVVVGKGYWMKVFEGNRDLTGFNDALKDSGGQCVMDIDLTPSEVEKLKKAKFMSEGKPSPEGNGLIRMRLKRKWTEKFAGGAPEVLRSDGNPWEYETDGVIGNGSIVAAVVDVYDTKASKSGIYGSRLSKVKVLEHVEYNKDDFADIEIPNMVTPKVVSTPVKEALDKRAILDDEIPF
jgi:hypothetical protein